MVITHISLCTGYAGLELGLHRALCDLSTIAYCDIELFACINLMAKMELGLLEAAPIWSNLKTFPWASFKDRVDILTGGFPCQPFSLAGKRGADQDPKHLWPYITKGIKELNYPNIVFFENVGGIATATLGGEDWGDPKGTSVLLHILRELERLGYAADAALFTASERGAPQERPRYFIMGVHKSASVSFNTQVLRDIKHIQQISQTQTTPQASATTIVTEFAQGTDAWPQPRGLVPYEWEPPRVVDAQSTNIVDVNHMQVNTEPSAYAVEIDNLSACEFDFQAASILSSSIEDESRLLGNGIVPAVAEFAFRLLFDRIVMVQGMIPTIELRPIK